MEVEEIQTQGSEFPRIRNDRISDFTKIGGPNGEDKYHDKDEEGMAGKRNALRSELVTAGALEQFCRWPASRIVRVSRASGGKDRHSKVWTSKGLRDRRVRLSVHTAIQFYDLQDRLGYDQPSKAVEWLLKAAAKSIDELPSINTTFADTLNQLSDERRSSGGTQQVPDSAELEMDTDANDLTLLHHQEQQHGSFSKSGCSSTSETSKGSGLSLSRSENRIKARERAKERRAERERERERERDSDSHVPAPNHLDANPLSQSSFTELLTGGHNNNNGSNGEGINLFHKPRQWPSSPMDYFSMPQSMSALQFSVGGEHHRHHPELQHFSLLPEHMIPVVSAAAGTGNGVDYNLNFTMSSSSSLAGMNRGTLQSNSPSSLLSHHLQRLSPLEGSNVPSLIGTTGSNSEPMEDHHHQQHHQFPAGLDGRLQLCYNGDGRHLNHKGKGKN